MERLVLGFSAFFALFLGSFFEGRETGESRSVTRNSKAQIEYD